MKFPLLLLAVCTVWSSCDYTRFDHVGNGNQITREINIGSFNKIKIEGGYEVFLNKGNENRIVIHADENLQEWIFAEVSEQELVLWNKESLRSPKGIRIEVTYSQEISEIDVSGASGVKNSGALNNELLILNMTGAGAITLTADVKDLKINMAGAGLIELSGYAENMDCYLRGAGRLIAYELQANDCLLEISGVGGAEINVSGKLKAKISGLGEVSYKGNPELIDNEVTGLGKITKVL